VSEHLAQCDTCDKVEPMLMGAGTTFAWQEPADWLRLSPAPNTATLIFCSPACVIKWCNTDGQKAER